MVPDYAQLVHDLPPPDAILPGLQPRTLSWPLAASVANGGGGGGGDFCGGSGGGASRRGLVVAAAQAPVLAPGEAELEAVKAVLQARLPLSDEQARSLSCSLWHRGFWVDFSSVSFKQRIERVTVRYSLSQA